MSRSVMLIAVSLVLLSLVACNTLVSKPKVVTEKDNNGTVEVNVGDTIELVLEASPSTGYKWEYTNADLQVIMQMGDPKFKADSSLLGAEGKETWRFKAARTGEKLVRMVYHRPYEKEEAPAKVFEVTIVVK